MRLLLVLLLLPLAPVWGQSAPQLRSGPMPGHASPDTALLWLQTTAACRVQVGWWPLGSPGLERRSAEYTAQAAEYFCLHIALAPLQPGTRYEYVVYLDGRRQPTEPPQRFRTPPADPMAQPQLVLAAGSCKLALGDIFTDSRKTRRTSIRMLARMAEHQPDLMLWLGDNVYMRAKDHGDRERVNQRYTYERAYPQLQALLRSANHYAIWDDHDFGPNDADARFEHRHLNREAFERFWANGHYGYASPADNGRRVRWGDTELFLLDNRSYREAYTQPGAQLLGPEQLSRLLADLQASTARFKLVLLGNQVLNDSPRNPKLNSNYHKLYRGEYGQLMRGLVERGLTDVVFLTGDRHFSEFARLDTAGITVWDLTFSPLSSPGMGFMGRERNSRRLPGSYWGRRSFGLIKLVGTGEKRQLQASICNRRGKPVRQVAISPRPQPD